MGPVARRRQRTRRMRGMRRGRRRSGGGAGGGRASSLAEARRLGIAPASELPCVCGQRARVGGVRRGGGAPRGGARRGRDRVGVAVAPGEGGVAAPWIDRGLGRPGAPSCAALRGGVALLRGVCGSLGATGRMEQGRAARGRPIARARWNSWELGAAPPDGPALRKRRTGSRAPRGVLVEAEGERRDQTKGCVARTRKTWPP